MAALMTASNSAFTKIPAPPGLNPSYPSQSLPKKPHTTAATGAASRLRSGIPAMARSQLPMPVAKSISTPLPKKGDAAGCPRAATADVDQQHHSHAFARTVSAARTTTSVSTHSIPRPPSPDSAGMNSDGDTVNPPDQNVGRRKSGIMKPPSTSTVLKGIAGPQQGITANKAPPPPPPPKGSYHFYPKITQQEISEMKKSAQQLPLHLRPRMEKMFWQMVEARQMTEDMAVRGRCLLEQAHIGWKQRVVEATREMEEALEEQKMKYEKVLEQKDIELAILRHKLAVAMARVGTLGPEKASDAVVDEEAEPSLAPPPIGWLPSPFPVPMLALVS